MQNEQEYYACQGPISDPGAYAHLYRDLRNDVESLVRVVQGLNVHIFWAARYGLELTPERQAEVQLRTIPRRLERALQLDSHPLAEPRALEKKLAGNCRDFSTLLVSMLRARGIPARARCGFGAYFMPEHYEDHWVAEYWNIQQGRWVLVDAQLDTFQSEKLGLTFDPLDVPRDQFIVGGKAWHMARSGAADPNTFGIFDMAGLGFIRGNLVRDLAALNRVELLPWDCWGIILSETLDDVDELALLDEVSALTAVDAPDYDRVRACYQNNPPLRMDGSLLSFVNGNMTPVQIAL